MKVEEPVSKRTVKDVACVKVWFRLLNQHYTALNHIVFKKTTNSALLCLEPHLVHPVCSSIGLQRHQVAYVRQFVRVLRTRPRPICWLSEIRRRLEGLLHNSPSPRSCACARSPLLRGYLHLFITRSLSLSSSSPHRTRQGLFVNRPLVVYYDHACALDYYCMARDPWLFRNVVFVIGKFHLKLTSRTTAVLAHTRTTSSAAA